MHITEQWILAHAPSPAVAEDGRSISAADRFLTRCRTEDACWGACAGSARNPYYVSIDWSLSEKEPLYSCSCASRHFPCKHALALLFDLLAGKPFDIDEPPAYLLRVRARERRERERAAQRLDKARKYDAAVKQKKLERQLAALDKAEKLSDQLLTDGLAAIPALPSQTLERMAAELDSCGVPAARDAFERIALLDRQRRQDGGSAQSCRAQMLRALLSLRALTARARTFLAEQLSSESYSLEDPLLFEALGGAWNNDELRELGLYRKSARLAQLSFDVSYDEAKRAYRERGFWLELSRGDVVQTQSLHPSRSLNYVGTDDSCFSLLEVPVLYESHVLPCPRVWWDDCASVELTAADYAAVLRRAEPIADAAARAKPHLGDPLCPDAVPALLRVGALGTIGDAFVLEDGAGGRITLRDRAADGAALASVRRLAALPVEAAAGDALFGLLFVDGGRLCLHPYSLIMAERIVRLQF